VKESEGLLAAEIQDRDCLLHFWFFITLMLVKALAIKTFSPNILNAGFDCRNKHFTQLTPCSGILLDKLKVSRIIMNFPSYYETQKFMMVFRTAQYWSAFYATRICPHSSQHYPSLYTNFYQVVSAPPPRPSFPAKNSCAPKPHHSCYMHVPSSPRCDEPNNIYRL
jgi:hypothetical protein